MALFDRLRLRFRLALSYFVVTLAAVVLVAFALDLAIALAFPAHYMWLPGGTLAEVVEAHPPPTDVERLSNWLARRAPEFQAFLPRAELRFLAVLGKDGRVLAAHGHETAVGTSYEELFRDSPQEASLGRAVAAALAGDESFHRTLARDEDGRVLEAVAVFDAEHRVEAVVVREIAFSLRGLLVEITDRVLILGALTAALGLIFGSWTARRLNERLERFAVAGERWGRGDFSAIIGDDSTDELGRLAAQLDEMATRLDGHISSHRELAVLEERHRLARDLHDAVKQHLFAASMQLGAARNRLGGGGVADIGPSLTRAADQLETAKRELADVIDQLRPEKNETMKPHMDIAALARSWASSSGIDTRVEVHALPELPAHYGRILLRVAQEALANAIRHSGAGKIEVHLAREGGAVVLRVSDDGAGFDPRRSSPGLGLRSMSQRLEAIGGTLSVDSAPGAGTRIIACCPEATE